MYFRLLLVSISLSLPKNTSLGSSCVPHPGSLRSWRGFASECFFGSCMLLYWPPNREGIGAESNFTHSFAARACGLHPREKKIHSCQLIPPASCEGYTQEASNLDRIKREMTLPLPLGWSRMRGWGEKKAARERRGWGKGKRRGKRESTFNSRQALFGTFRSLISLGACSQATYPRITPKVVLNPRKNQNAPIFPWWGAGGLGGKEWS